LHLPVAIACLVAMASAGWWIAAWFAGLNAGARDGVAAGALFAAVMASAGFAANAGARRLSARRFIRIMAGGMLVRLLVVAAAAVAIIFQRRLDPAATMMAFGIVYCASLAAEALCFGFRIRGAGRSDIAAVQPAGSEHAGASSAAQKFPQAPIAGRTAPAGGNESGDNL
jgi:hypothetical protein